MLIEELIRQQTISIIDKVLGGGGGNNNENKNDKKEGEK